MVRDPETPMTPLRRGFRRCAALALRAIALVWIASPAWAVPISGLVISEVMYEPVALDNGGQWVEIYNGTGGTIDLSLYELQWGRFDLADSIVLSGTLAAGDTFVIGGPNSDNDNGNPTFDQVFNFNPNLGDGGHVWQEDGIALVESASGIVQHIVVYGGDGVGVPYVDEQGATAVAIDDSALNPGESLEFLGGSTWQVAATPDPGAVDPALVPVPEPTPLVLLGLGLMALATLRPSRWLAGVVSDDLSRAHTES